MITARRQRAIIMGELVADAVKVLTPPATPEEGQRLLDALTAVEEYMALLTEVEK